MDERFFNRLHGLLGQGPVVVASVLATRGATPRKAGSRMLVTPHTTEFSIGGGLAEARVIDAALSLLGDAGERTGLDIDLTGQPGAAGICGGRMRIALRRWHDAEDVRRAADIARTLRSGARAELAADALGDAEGTVAPLHPNPRLLIVGGGHCSVALAELARPLDFDLWVFDPRTACFDNGQFVGATTRSGSHEALADAFDTGREVHAVLLNRDYGGDVASLRVLQDKPLAFVGMMGSRRRIAEVRAAFAPDMPLLAALHAPVGLEIGAHTPHEIAVSILAQLIRHRAGPHAP